MQKRERLGRIVEQMAMWALDYRSPDNHDEDIVGRVGDHDVTVGDLRWAFERYFKQPFSTYQESPRAWLNAQQQAHAAQQAAEAA